MVPTLLWPVAGAITALVALALILVGYLVVRAAGFRPGGIAEGLVLSGALGLVAITLPQFLYGWLGIWGMLVGLGPVAAAFLIARRGTGEDTPGPTMAGSLPILFFAALAAWIASPGHHWIEPFGPNSDGWHLNAYWDHLYHTAIGFELLRGVPPVQMPFVAGAPFFAYHFFPDLVEATVARWGSLDLLLVHFTVLPPILWLLLLVGLGAVGRRTNGQALTGLVFITIFTGTALGNGPLLTYLSRNPPALYGLVLLAGILLLVQDYERRRTAGGAALVGLLSACLFYFKANYFLVLFPAFALWLARIAWAGERRNALAGGLAGLAVVPMLAHYVSLPRTRSIRIDYGAYATTDLAAALEPFGSAALALGPWLGPILIVLAHAAVRVVGYPSLIVLAIGAVGLRDREWRSRRWLAPLLGAAAAWVAVVLFLVEDAGRFSTWNVAGHSTPAISLLVYLGVASVLGELIRRYLPARHHRAALGAILVILLARGAGHLDHSEYDEEGSDIAPSFARALAVIRSETPLESVILSGRHLTGPTYLSGLSGRRTILERADTFVEYVDGVEERRMDIEEAYETKDRDELMRILEAYSVTHVLEWRSKPLQVADLGGLHLFADVGSIRLYEVRQPEIAQNLP